MTTDTRPTIAPQVGKRYVLRNGALTGVIRERDDRFYPFTDGFGSWARTGEFWANGLTRHSDLIAEYVEPVAEPVESRAPHPEDFCERCGRENACWFAPSEIWNLACRDHGIICPVCFIKLTEAAGLIPTGWQVAPENYGKTDWIPVTERLPEIAATCWVAIEMRYEVITRLAYCERSGNWQHIDARPILSPVLAWQPIIEPEAYKP